MIGVRLNTFNDSSGEPEQDANSALTELDKGLRSGKVGEQCEAIVRFPRLFEKYPFPILINSSFLKLADVFRMGNNFLRLWVLRVCQQSEKHLDKILNVDEFLRRVYSVLHSNDPVARALALRTLGAVAGIIPERQNVHHAIRRGLDSHDNVEVDAAIYATTRFAAHSNAFAVAMCNKLSDMVECESTGAERRAKLVRALRSVHGGAVRAQGVLKLLRSLLERFPSSSSVRAAITALTAIAADTVVHVPDQVELLLSIAMNDARCAVRRAALVGLKKLAEHAALWPSECLQNLVRAATDSQDAQHTMLCLQVMQILVECPAICANAGSQSSALRQYCVDAAFSIDLHQAAIACDVLTRIVVHCYEESLPVDGSELILALESLVIATSVDNGPANIKPLRIALRCLVKLCTAEPALYAPRTANVLGTQLLECQWSEGGPRILALLEALGALGGGTYCPRSLTPALPALVHTLEAAMRDPTTDGDGTALVLLCTVLFQERAGTALTCKINNSWEQKIMDTIRYVDGWTRYRVARAALRYGHYGVAASILQRLAATAPSEAAQRWLTALHRAAAADRQLIQQGITGLEEASAGWEASSGCGAICGWGAGCAAGCAGCGGCAPLPPAAMHARAAALAALGAAAAAARALCTQPPPAIAHAHAQGAPCTRAPPRSPRWAPPPPPRARSARSRRPPLRTRTHRYTLTGRAMHARAAALAALGAAAAAARALCTQPPPAIAHAHAQAARDPAAKAGACASAIRKAARAVSAVAQRYAAIARTAFHAGDTRLIHYCCQAARDPAAKAGACASAIRKAARAVSAVAQRYAAIARTAFHADDATLTHLHIAQHTYAQLAYFLDRITSSQDRPLEPPTKEIKPKTLEEMIALAPSNALARISDKLFDSTTGQSITHRHAEAILAAVRACAVGAGWARGVCAGRAGGALCRVSLTPAWRAPPAEHAATLPLSHRLALKLEGVVLPAVPLSKRQSQRQVKGVQITVTATPHPRTNEKTVELTNVPPVLTAVQTVTPIRDFFSAQQLVSVNAAGLYTVAVEAAFVDEKGELWNTGPRTSIVIKAHEEPSAKGITQATRSRF